MRPATTRPPAASTLYVAFELGSTEWKLAMTTRIDQAPLVCTRAARTCRRPSRAPLSAPFVRRGPLLPRFTLALGRIHNVRVLSVS